jgi:hypothetical protein
MKYQNTKMKKIIIYILLLLNCANAFSQTVIVRGKIINAENTPLEGANVVLQTMDSIFVCGSATDTKGNFAIKNITPGNYYLNISFVGYKPERLLIKNLSKNQSFGNIRLNSATVLKEAVVVGKRAYYKVDRQILIPTHAQRDISNNGLTLIRNMQLSRIKINPLDNSISTQNGETVVLQINGVNAQATEIAAIPSKNIVRVEYNDAPGLRYDTGAVVNFIVKQRESGGYVMANGMQTLSNKGIKRYGAASGYNWSKSQLVLTTDFDENKASWTRDNEYQYTLPDKTVLRTETGIPTLYKDKTLNASLKYVLQDADKYMLSITLRDSYNHVPNQFSDRQGTVNMSNTTEVTSLKDLSSWRGNTPSADIYFQRNIKNDQLILFDVVGTYIKSNNTHTYTENSESGNLLTDIYSHIDGKKYSIIAEGIYEKKFKEKGILNAGAHYQQSYTDNKYTGDVTSDIDLRFSESYLFQEYRFIINKWDSKFGLREKYMYYGQQNSHTGTFSIQPTWQLKYAISDNSFIRYSGSLSNNTPDLADLNNTEQALDTWQVQRGNPSLKSYKLTYQDITMEYNRKLWGIELYSYYSYFHHPIMASIFYENGKFVNMNENQKAKHQFKIETTLTLRPLKDYISIDVTPGINRFVSYGNTYTHEYTNWYIRGSLMANYKRFFLYAQMNTRNNFLGGETIEYNEKFHSITTGYNAPKWSLSVGVFNPYTKEYSQSSRNLSHLLPSYSEVHCRNLCKMFYLSASFNLDFGHRKGTADQKTSNSDTNAGILKSGKTNMK